MKTGEVSLRCRTSSYYLLAKLKRDDELVDVITISRDVKRVDFYVHVGNYSLTWSDGETQTFAVTEDKPVVIYK